MHIGGRRIRALSVSLALTFSTSCGGSDGGSGSGGTGPSGSAGTPSLGPCDSTSCSNNQAGVFVSIFATNRNSVGADPAFTFTFAGLSLSATGRKTFQIVGLAAGEYELSGQMASDGLQIGFSPSGGLRPVSVQFVQTPVGPLLSRSCSGLDWATPFGAALTLPQPVRLRISTVTGGAPTCLN